MLNHKRALVFVCAAALPLVNGQSWYLESVPAFRAASDKAV